EEFLMRLFGLSALVWLLSHIWPVTAGASNDPVFWMVNIAISILFGLGHLPATKSLVGHISPLIFARALLLNGVVGLVFGWLYWHYGIEAAVIAHFVTDIVFHCGGTVVLRLNDRYHFVKTGQAASV